MKRTTVQIERAALFSALAQLRRALTRGYTRAALRALDSIYRLLPIELETPSRAR